MHQLSLQDHLMCHLVARAIKGDEDIRVLNLAAAVFEQYKGAAFVNQFEGVVDKLSRVVRQLREPRDRVISFETAPYYKGMEHFDVLLNNIIGKQALNITYRKFNSPPDVHLFHPYFLKEYKNRWYVLGYSDSRHYHLTLGLDRIEAIANAAVSYKENKKLKPDEYFNHTIGITLGKGKPEEIKLYFTPVQANYIKTQYLHHTQAIVQDDEDGLIVTLQLIPNYELLQLLLSFGPEAEVLKPLSLRMQVKEMVEKMMGRYGERSDMGHS